MDPSLTFYVNIVPDAYDFHRMLRRLSYTTLQKQGFILFCGDFLVI